MTAALDALIEGAAERVGVERACRALGTPPRSYRHRSQARQGRARPRGRAAHARATEPVAIDDALLVASEAATAVTLATRAAERRPHPASLSSDERLEILELVCSERFADLSPRQVFMALLDEGVYYCSIRSMYRLLEDHGLSGERRRGAHQQPGAYPVPVIEASRPNVAWSWDITKLRGPSKGVLYYLYAILDIFSRKVVGWTIALRESAVIAEDVIRDAIAREGIEPHQLTLHADRGGPMIAGGVADLLLGIGVTKRPTLTQAPQRAWIN